MLLEFIINHAAFLPLLNSTPLACKYSKSHPCQSNIEALTCPPFLVQS